MKKENLSQYIRRSAQIGFLGVALAFGGVQDSCDSSGGGSTSPTEPTLSSGVYCSENGTDCTVYNPFPENGTCPPTIKFPWGGIYYLKRCDWVR